MLLALGAALARIPVHDFPVWLPALPFGTFLLFGVVRNGYSIYNAEALSGVGLREQLNLATDPTLYEDVVRLRLNAGGDTGYRNQSGRLPVGNRNNQRQPCDRLPIQDSRR